MALPSNVEVTRSEEHTSELQSLPTRRSSDLQRAVGDDDRQSDVRVRRDRSPWTRGEGPRHVRLQGRVSRDRRHEKARQRIDSASEIYAKETRWPCRRTLK